MLFLARALGHTITDVHVQATKLHICVQVFNGCHGFQYFFDLSLNSQNLLHSRGGGNIKTHVFCACVALSSPDSDSDDEDSMPDLHVMEESSDSETDADEGDLQTSTPHAASGVNHRDNVLTVIGICAEHLAESPGGDQRLLSAGKDLRKDLTTCFSYFIVKISNGS